MTYLFPVYQVGRVENGYSWVNGKRRAYQVVVGTFFTDTGVRVAALQYRIVELAFIERIFFVYRIFSCIGELTENRYSWLRHGYLVATGGSQET